MSYFNPIREYEVINGNKVCLIYKDRVFYVEYWIKTSSKKTPFNIKRIGLIDMEFQDLKWFDQKGNLSNQQIRSIKQIQQEVMNFASTYDILSS